MDVLALEAERRWLQDERQRLIKMYFDILDEDWVPHILKKLEELGRIEERDLLRFLFENQTARIAEIRLALATEAENTSKPG